MTPRRLILGSDWWTDCDDAVALRLAARAHLRGDICLLGVSLDACAPQSVPSADAFLTLEGLPNFPIGIDRSQVDCRTRITYQHRLAALPGPWRSNEEAEEGVAFYRRLLAEAEGPVDIAEIGFSQVLAALLDSPPDGLSPLPGEALIREKVGCLWMMAGKWDEPGGREYNIADSPRSRAAAERICRRWPTPIVYLGFEVGVSVITGSGLEPGDPLRTAMEDHGSGGGRSSWDPMLVELCLMGDPAAAGYELVRGWARVDPETGANFFAADGKGPHGYVVKQLSDAAYAARLDAAIASAKK